MPSLLEIAGKTRTSFAIFIHILRTGEVVLQDLPQSAQKVAGDQFQPNESLFAAFFEDENVGKQQWDAIAAKYKANERN